MRLGSGSIYDWVVEEIFAAGPEDSEGMGDDKHDDIAVAMRMLAAFRRKRSLRRMVERAFDEVEREMRQGVAPPARDDDVLAWSPPSKKGRKPRSRSR